MKKNWRKEMGTDYYLVDLFHGYVFENSKKNSISIQSGLLLKALRAI